MKKKILFGGLCLLLLILLGGFLVYCRKEEKQQVDENKMLREQMTDTVQSVMADGDTATAECTIGDEGESKEVPAQEESTVQEHSSIEPEAVEKELTMISFRGDSFLSDDKVQENGIGALLKKKLDYQQIDMQVRDYSMYQAGSMAQLRLAGVDETVIEGYLKRHTDNENDMDLSVFETKVRSAEDMDLERDDQEAIPVICMGYYGGWYNDPEELIKQIQDILGTYAQQEKYLVAGLYPNVDVDKELYKTKMEEAWGEHYLQLDDEIDSSPSKKAGREDIAAAVFEKLQSLGYLSTGE